MQFMPADVEIEFRPVQRVHMRIVEAADLRQANGLEGAMQHGRRAARELGVALPERVLI